MSRIASFDLHRRRYRQRGEPLPGILLRVTDDLTISAPDEVRAELEDPRCSATLQLEIEGGRLVCAGYSVACAPGGLAHLADLLKALPVVALIQCALEGVQGIPLHRLWARTGGLDESSSGWADIPEEEMSLAQVFADERFETNERAAVAYRVGFFVGANPVTMVSAALDISPAAAAKRVQRAREAGLLEPTTKGKKGA